jgi:hypothetical protein
MDFVFWKNPARTVSLQLRRIKHPKVLFEKLTLIENTTHIQVFKNKRHQEGFKSFSKHEMYQALNYLIEI